MHATCSIATERVSCNLQLFFSQDVAPKIVTCNRAFKYLYNSSIIYLKQNLCFLQQRLKQEEEERQKEYERLLLTQAKAGILMERELERKRKQQERDQALENNRLAAEQKAT